jgi:hypothetical protein
MSEAIRVDPLTSPLHPFVHPMLSVGYHPGPFDIPVRTYRTGIDAYCTK